MERRRSLNDAERAATFPGGHYRPASETRAAYELTDISQGAFSEEVQQICQAPATLLALTETEYSCNVWPGVQPSCTV